MRHQNKAKNNRPATEDKQKVRKHKKQNSWRSLSPKLVGGGSLPSPPNPTPDASPLGFELRLLRSRN